MFSVWWEVHNLTTKLFPPANIKAVSITLVVSLAIEICDVRKTFAKKLLLNICSAVYLLILHDSVSYGMKKWGNNKLKCSSSYLEMFLPVVTRQLEGTSVAHLTSVELLWSNKLVRTGQQSVVGRIEQPLACGFHATTMFFVISMLFVRYTLHDICKMLTPIQKLIKKF
jgi:hypothetical protein